MAPRKSKTAVKADLSAFDQAGARVLNNPLTTEVEDSYLEYAYSVIHSRALPDARDGLKPVHRRILFSMNEQGHRPDRGHVKSSRVVGDVMGKYHPHGDSAIYDAMVRMAQDFSLNVPLIDGHGNFGSPDDGPAASRYTEARMSREAMLLVGELDEGTVDFRPNYDGSLEEPAVLPAAFPNLLVNGSSGIAVGMATNMIPHNLGEIVAATRWLINHPAATLDKLMEFVPGPDLPTGGLLLGLDEVRRAYETGRGVVRMRGRVEIGLLEGSRGRQAITVTELPYGIGAEKVIEKITDEVNKTKRLQGIADVKDLTDRENGTRLVIECKVGVNPQALLADLYRLTPLEQSFGVNNLVLVDGQPQTLGLKALLEVFLAHRYEVVTRRTEFRRKKRQDRLHLVDGLLIALLDIDRVIALIRDSDNAAAAKAGLMSEFGLTDIQATYILDTPLRRLTRYDRIELEAEQQRLNEEIAALSLILDDEKVLKKVVSDELAAVVKEHAAPRRTTLIDGDLKEVLAASVPAGPLEVTDDPCQVLLSATGLVARTAAESEEAPEAKTKAGRDKHDAVRAVVHTTARGQILLVTSRGRAFKVDVLPLPTLPERPGTVSISGGMSTAELVPLEKGETVVGLAPPRRQGLRLARPRPGHPQRPGQDLRPGVARALRRVRGHRPARGRRGHRRHLARRRLGDPRVRQLRLVAAALPGDPGPPAGPEGRRHGRHQPRRRRPRTVLRRRGHQGRRARRADGRHRHHGQRQDDPVAPLPGQGPRHRRGAHPALPQGRDAPRPGLGRAAPGRLQRQGRPARPPVPRQPPRRLGRPAARPRAHRPPGGARLTSAASRRRAPTTGARRRPRPSGTAAARRRESPRRALPRARR
ncbi:hypothetical protein GCM10020218_003980 [Dactylosporangium vinaceum]